MDKKQTNPIGIKESVWSALMSKYTEAGVSDILNTCPYMLAVNQDVRFEIIDEYVMSSVNIDLFCPARIRNALLYILGAIEKGVARRDDDDPFAEHIRRIAGSTCIPKGRIYELIETLLGLEADVIEMPLLDRVIKSLVISGKVSLNRIDNQVYLANKKTFAMERDAAERISALLELDGLVKKNDAASKAMYEAIDASQAMTGLILSQEQKNAVCTILQSRISVMTGGPGTGKSATQRILVESCRLLKRDAAIRCIAPTGQAASRMAEATGISATTIHKALGMTPDEPESRCTLLPDDLVIVDEASMIDIHVFSSLLKSISEKTSIVFIGDSEQLPSVGPGNVLSSLLCSDVPRARLTKVFRQGDNAIAFNCAKIKNGKTDLDLDESFRFIECSDSESIKKTVCRIYAEEAEKNGIESVCCLTPYRRRTKTGVNSLNRAIRSKLHDTKALSWCERGGMRIYTGDKIVFLRNKYGLVNGETGTALRCTIGQCICRFDDREVTLSGDDLECIEPSYAATVHKAQGQEYTTCIIVIDEEHSSFLSKGLIYTSISRAREKCICVGSMNVMKQAIAAGSVNERCSALSHLIRKKQSH